jgi:ketosteroid isomerase-like protein
MKTSKLILLLCAFLVVGCDRSAPDGESRRRDASADASDSDSAAAISQAEEEIRELDQTQARAWVARDQTALERLWSPEFVLQAPSNQILTREGVFREMGTPRLAGGLASMERTVERVTQFGNLVISMGVEHPVNKTGPTAGVVRTQRYTNVWRRDGNTWRVIARHAHLLPLDPGQPPASSNQKP